MNPAETMAELKATLQRVQELTTALVAEPVSAEHSSKERVGELETKLAESAADFDEISTRLAGAERQAGSLMSLYVATYQLHATLDPEEVKAAIAEIVRELLGARCFVLLVRGEEDGQHEVALAEGLDGDHSGYGGKMYLGGDPVVDETLRDGVLRVGPFDASEALAVVPLTVQGIIVGGIVLLELLAHKAALVDEDRELLDLLAAHAASALFAARIYSATDRKMRTLEGLVQLVRGGVAPG